MFRLPLTALIVAGLALAASCERIAPPRGDGQKRAPSATHSTASSGPLAVPHVTDEAENLLFSYVDMRGEPVSVGSVAEVPESVRERVLVVDLSKSPAERQADRYAFFVNLNARNPDGSYEVTTVSRYNPARSRAAPAPAMDVPEDAVIVYSAVWCGFCKKAKRWLKQKGVPFIERDVEKTPGAQAELSRKLRAARLQSGGVPVIDWAGELVVGFDQRRLERLLAERPPKAH